ncbi:hypothetical protein SUGI_0016620 [Cryptomeria japonica]|uniref:UPF0161 protein At3g09310 isoform X2 n=1 Tax=Cryptomeria japonica TaxID=3369 RepID=UPI002408BF13|nr:UPF0161 protein At3g09310 isoform X2 [Cryptomeria japonica]GLJ05347.1 hypothetical protein SUGI_0016620 [Cryptomeria japonica]
MTAESFAQINSRQRKLIELIDRLSNPKRIVYAWCSNEDSIEEDKAGREAKMEEKDVQGPGVEAALALLTFYKREISPLLPSSCRYVPSCSEYSMQAYKRYGVLKGTVLTAWRLCRCNPLGGSGFDPPRWFDESKPPSP